MKTNKYTKFLFSFLIFLVPLSLYSKEEKQIIYIYNGPGASEVSLKHTEYTMKKLVDSSHYNVEMISPERIKEDNWENNTALFIMPGGADIPYTKHLNGNGNQKIREYVENGGKYLGICAGSYYAGSQIEFAKGTNMEVVGPRELGFFNGMVKGPVLAEYDYKSCAGCRAAYLMWHPEPSSLKSTPFYAFYNGGGYFADAEKKPNTHVVASYKTPSGLKPAVIEIMVGKGKVILSGPHWERDPEIMDVSDPYLKKIIPFIEQTNEQRITFTRYLLKQLGLRLYHSNVKS